MIELVIKGICKACPFRELAFNSYDETINCKHTAVCKFIGDPEGKERLDAAVKTLEERSENDD